MNGGTNLGDKQKAVSQRGRRACIKKELQISPEVFKENHKINHDLDRLSLKKDLDFRFFKH